MDDTIEKVLVAGGRVVRRTGPGPGIGWLAYSSDSEGNLFGVMQDDPAAL